MSTVTRRTFGLCCASFAATSLPALSTTSPTITLPDGTTIPHSGRVRGISAKVGTRQLQRRKLCASAFPSG
jgi:hypothetical protein